MMRDIAARIVGGMPPTLARLRQAFEVAREAARLAEPGEGLLDQRSWSVYRLTFRHGSAQVVHGA